MMTEYPYPGLRPFTREESFIFFGRETHTDHLLKKLGDTRFISVTGLSGCGKSSLVRAGMIPALECGYLATAGPYWQIATMRPGTQPLANLANALLKNTVVGIEGIQDPEEKSQKATILLPFILASLYRGPLGLVETLRETPLPEQTNLLILVDQFEELFRYHREGGRNEAVAFVNLLLESTKQEEIPIYVVTTMRSRFIGDCALFYDLPEIMNRGQFLTPRLTRNQQREAIEGPARVFGTTIEARLVNTLLNEMGSDPDQLPLLQHCLMRMWLHAQQKTDPTIHISFADYDAVGELKNALSNHANEAFQELNKTQQNVAEIMFRCLTERTADGDIRRPMALESIAEVTEIPISGIKEIIEVFRHPERSFLTPSADKDLQADSMVDISHESLIRQWDKLQHWVSQEAESAEEYQSLAEKARWWKAEKRDVLDSPYLEKASAWRKQEQPTATWAQRYDADFDLAMEFLDTSEQVHEKRVRRHTFISKFSTTPYIVALFMFCLLWVSFFDILSLDTRVEHFTIGFGDLLAEIGLVQRKDFDEQIVMVSIDKKSEEKYGKFGARWRPYHAELVEHLSQAGAKTIMFVITFGEARPEYDSAFIQAVEKATAQGTGVIIGIEDFEEGEPLIVEGLRGVVSGFGTACANTQLGYARSIPLVIAKNIPGKYVPSLAFETFLKYENMDNYIIDKKHRQILLWKSQRNIDLRYLEFSELDKTTSVGCPVIQQGDEAANLLINFSPLEVLRDPTRRYSYVDILEDAYTPSQFEDKIVIVGVENFDAVSVASGIFSEERYGFEIYADALNALLNKVTLRELNNWLQLLLMLILGWFGASIRYWLPTQTLWRRSLFGIVLLSFLIGTIYLASVHYVLLSTLYHIGTFWGSYWITGKWFL